jgi:squalene synthase HpnC
MTASDFASGKTHRDENFPVASLLIAARHRAPILAFYRFVRAADDVADNPALAPERKLALIDALEATLLGRSEAEADALPLRAALAARGLGPRHALDLLQAFRRDVGKTRTRDFADLLDYCSYSAMPVGRFVLDVHGEDEALWPLSDAICAALQINNHLQDCGSDYRQLDRVYVPLEDLTAQGIGPEALGAPRATPQLRACLLGLARRTRALLDEGAALPDMIADPRLGMEIAVIVRLARRINDLLLDRDPLSENVHLSKPAAIATTLTAVCVAAIGRLRRARSARRNAEAA